MKRPHKHSLAAFAVGATILFGCAPEPQAEDELEMPDKEVPAGETQPLGDARGSMLKTVEFEPWEGGDYGPINGAVEVFQGDTRDGDYRLTVRLGGLGPGEHAWHIHSGPCDSDAPVVVSFTPSEKRDENVDLSKPLIPGEGGVAEATVTVPHDQLSLDELVSGEYSLHVHQTAGVDHGPTVACANL